MNLIEIITDKAKAGWVGTFPLNRTNPRFKQWEEHWLATGRAWQNELIYQHDIVKQKGKRVEINRMILGLKYILNYYEDGRKWK